MTNYQFFLAGNGGDIADLLLGSITREEFQRPVLHQQIRIKGRLFEVIRINPSNNPTGQLVQYFVEPLNLNKPYRARSKFDKITRRLP